MTASELPGSSGCRGIRVMLELYWGFVGVLLSCIGVIWGQWKRKWKLLQWVIWGIYCPNS